MTLRYDGTTTATDADVRRYLSENYTDANGEPLEKAQIDAFMKTHADTVSRAINSASFAYYPGDRIADAESLAWIPDATDDETEGDA